MRMKQTALKDVCVCLLISAGIIFGHETGPAVVRVVVEEGSDVVLPCSLSSKENIVDKLFDWRKDGQKKKKEVFMYDAGDHSNNGQDEQFKGRVSHFSDQLKNGNASIKIRDTKISDSGKYTCDFPRLQPSQTFYIELVVELTIKDRSGEITGASPDPYIRILNPTEDGALLQCEVRGASPKPKVEWKDSAGNILPAEETQVSDRGGRYYVTLLTTVTKTDHYRCVVTQEEIHHQTHSETYVFINDPVLKERSGEIPGAALKPYTRTLTATEDGALLQCVVEGASPKPKVEWKDRAGNILPAEEPQVSDRGGSYDVTLLTTVTKTDHYRCVVTQEEIHHQTHSETYVFIYEKLRKESSSKGWLLGGGLVLLVLTVAAVLALVWFIKRRRIKEHRSRERLENAEYKKKNLSLSKRHQREDEESVKLQIDNHSGETELQNTLNEEESFRLSELQQREDEESVKLQNGSPLLGQDPNSSSNGSSE
ncbi:butyrophilin subfamily 2 member A1-like isoform X5 [Dicentrarchus labrax]|uniref:butyrophilin subfamily 2 member A1-like isoform X5 n=1 Tax=Dicentrarchus labrax TaxID=13489 RepID=UPI0021F658A6|nr:butyrophilin subfamily 2 member A1-like isoform X5 [Dicentrarchus labrax]